MEEEKWDVLQRGERKRLHEMYSDQDNFLQKFKKSYREKTKNISEGVCNFIENNRERLERAEKTLDLPLFMIYAGIAAADFIATYNGCEHYLLEGHGIVRELMKNHGIGDGLLISALGDMGIVGGSYDGRNHIERMANRLDPRIEKLPFFRNLAYYLVAGIGTFKHYKGMSSWL